MHQNCRMSVDVRRTAWKLAPRMLQPQNSNGAGRGEDGSLKRATTPSSTNTTKTKKTKPKRLACQVPTISCKQTHLSVNCKNRATTPLLLTGTLYSVPGALLYSTLTSLAKERIGTVKHVKRPLQCAEQPLRCKTQDNYDDSWQKHKTFDALRGPSSYVPKLDRENDPSMTPSVRASEEHFQSNKIEKHNTSWTGYLLALRKALPWLPCHQILRLPQNVKRIEKGLPQVIGTLLASALPYSALPFKSPYITEFFPLKFLWFDNTLQNKTTSVYT